MRGFYLLCQSTLSKVKEDFHLTMVEGKRFLPPIEPIPPTLRLQTILEELPWAIAVIRKGSVWGCQPGFVGGSTHLNQQISVFLVKSSMWMRKQDSMTFVISSVAPQNNWRSKHRQSLSWRRRSLTSSLELDSALLRWLRLNASTQPKVNHTQLMESLLEHYGGF